jgi:hypothetical protein
MEHLPVSTAEMYCNGGNSLPAMDNICPPSAVGPLMLNPNPPLSLHSAVNTNQARPCVSECRQAGGQMGRHATPVRRVTRTKDGGVGVWTGQLGVGSGGVVWHSHHHVQQQEAPQVMPGITCNEQGVTTFGGQRRVGQ